MGIEMVKELNANNLTDLVISGHLLWWLKERTSQTLPGLEKEGKVWERKDGHKHDWTP